MIDWDRVEGRAKKPAFTQAQIDAAVAAVQALPQDDDGCIEPFWPRADKMPKISKLDFGTAVQVDTDLASLQASTKRMRVTKLVWHIQHPGQPMNKNPFTVAPVTCIDDDGNVIIFDGHHRLASLMLLGVTTWPTWQMPVKPQD